MTGANTTQRPIAPRQDTSRKERGGVILLYHRVADAATDPQLLCVSPDRFRDQLAMLTCNHTVISLSELVDRSAVGKLADRSVALTFDDGYVDNLTNAAPLLRAFSAPATVFVASGYIGERREFWWDVLERLLLRPGTLPRTLSVRMGDVTRAWDLDRSVTYQPADFERHRRWSVVERDDPTPRHRAYRALFELLRPMKPTDRDAAIERLKSQSQNGVAPASCRCFHGLEARATLVDGISSNRERRTGVGEAGSERSAVDVGSESKDAMTSDQLRRLASDPFIEIGGHTVNHPVLSTLTIDEQRREITQCKIELETLIDKPVTSFSYPFGGRRDYTSDTIALVRDAGFAQCCSNFVGWVTPHGDAFQLPRLLVRDWDGDTLLQRIEEVAYVG